MRDELKKDTIINTLKNLLKEDNDIQKLLSDYIEIEVKKRMDIIENKYYKNKRQHLKSYMIEGDEETLKKNILLEHKRKNKKSDDYFKAVPKILVDDKRLLEIYNFLINNDMMEGEFKHFKIACNSAMPFVHPNELPRKSQHLNWIDKTGVKNKNKNKFTYTNLFTVLHKYVYLTENNPFKHPQRKIFITSLASNYLFDGKIVKEESISTAYTNWTFNNNLIID
ncbi:hypothetical protein [Empedobacter stercoris]|uniref:hypothetical protein n=1 Tax=Empedobacter stercoris TaxID=1628248 RepID=UPI0039EC7A41